MALKSRLGPMKYAVVISVGCSALLVRAATSTAGPSANSGAANAIATVNGEPISQKEFAESLSRVQMGLDFAVYDMQIGVVQQLIDDVLMAQEARKRGKTLAEFRSEIENGISIEDSLVTIVYLENRSDFAGISESEARQHIRDRLRKVRPVNYTRTCSKVFAPTLR